MLRVLHLLSAAKHLEDLRQAGGLHILYSLVFVFASIFCVLFLVLSLESVGKIFERLAGSPKVDTPIRKLLCEFWRATLCFLIGAALVALAVAAASRMVQTV